MEGGTAETARPPAAEVRRGEGPANMAPEIKAGGQGTVASDIYSLGLVGSEMLLGHLGEAAEIRSTCPDVPTEFVALLEWMRAETPACRPDRYGRYGHGGCVFGTHLRCPMTRRTRSSLAP